VCGNVEHETYQPGDHEDWLEDPADRIVVVKIRVQEVKTRKEERGGKRRRGEGVNDVG
jgi:hypothetical protein